MRPARVSGSVRENDWADVGSLLGTLSPRQELELRRDAEAASAHFKRTLGLRDAPIELRGRTTGLEVRATGIAGTVRLGPWAIDISPKFVDTAAAEEGWQSSVLLLVARARGRHVGFNPAIGLGRAGLSFVDHMALAYADAIERAAMEEPIHAYRERQERIPVLRGRLNLSRQLNKMWSSPGLLECDVEYLDTDNRHNQLLHWAAERYASLAITPDATRRMEVARELLPTLPGRVQLPSRLNSHVPPQYRIWQGAIDLAIELARGEATSMERGSVDGYGFVLGMENLFERFLEVSLSRALKALMPGVQLVPQDSRAFAFPLAKGRKLYTRPDDVLYRAGRPVAVIDAKYKRLATSGDLARLRKPRNPDVYQMLAAMTALRCRRALLVYPRVAGQLDLGDDELRWWSIPTFGEEVRVAAVAIDLLELKSRSDLRQLDRRLADIVSNVLRDTEEEHAVA